MMNCQPSPWIARCRPVFAAGLAAMLASGCGTVKRAGMAVLYKEAVLPPDQVVEDIPYGQDPRQKLDLYLPSPTDRAWPVAVFIHGGSWTGGDKQYRVGGKDVYANIGRYLAGRGIGTAVINYRLQPGAGWKEQVSDAAEATAWVYQNIRKRSGDPDSIFLIGHSAGAQLAAFAALDADSLPAAGVRREAVRGIVPVSGTGYDLEDAATFSLGHSPAYYRSVFDPGAKNPGWQREASIVQHLAPVLPPALVLHGGREDPAMIRQSVVLHEALRAHGAASTLLAIPRMSHGRMVLAMGRPDQQAGPAIVDFIHRHARRID